MKVTEALRAGLAKVLRSPGFVFWLYIAGLASAIPLALTMRSILRRAVGSSLVQENLRAGFDMSWYGEFELAGSGLAETFGPWVVGILAPLANLEKLLDGKLFEVDPTVLMGGLLYLLAWVFVTGGVIARYSGREDSRGRGRFFAYCGEFFLPFLRLTLLSVVVYLGIFRWVARPLFRLLEDWTRDVTVERTVLLWTLAIYVVAGALFVVLSCALDYAKISMVVEKRKSSVLALLGGLRFILARPTATLGLYLSLVAVGFLLLLLYYPAAPGPGQSGAASVIFAFAVSQVYLLSRVTLKLWFLASQAGFYTGIRRGDQAVRMPVVTGEVAREGSGS